MSENFSIRLKSLRTSHQISQKALGENIGLSMQAINEIEHGRRATTLEKLISIADYFDISIDYLVGRSDDPRRY